MGLLTDFVIADDTDAEAICASNDHLNQWPSLEAKGVDNIKLAALWAALTTDADVESLEGDAFLIHMADKQGPWVFRLPDDLVEHLAALSPETITDVAARWSEHEELQYDGWTPDVAASFLGVLTLHAQRAVTENKPLLLWMCM